MNPEKAKRRLEGARLAFAQGGPDGFKLVHVTPPVKVVQHTTFCEARWEPGKMLLGYADAPLLIDNQGNTQVPSLKERIRPLDRTTWLGRFASAFRSRCTPVVKDIAQELIGAHRRQSAKRGVVAKSYV